MIDAMEFKGILEMLKATKPPTTGFVALAFLLEESVVRMRSCPGSRHPGTATT